MKWLKKQFNKMFFAIEEEDDQFLDHQTPVHNEAPITEQSQKKFVFPDVKEFEKKPSKEANVTEEEQDSKLMLPKHLRQDGGISKVYEVEVSGIGDLLERRRNGNRYKPARREEPIKISAKQTIEEQAFLTGKAETKVTAKAKVPVTPKENRKKFVPTNVPSPVHGFQRVAPAKPKEASTIEQLLERKNEEAATTVKPLPDVTQLESQLNALEEAVKDELQQENEEQAQVDNEKLAEEVTLKDEVAVKDVQEETVVQCAPIAGEVLESQYEQQANYDLLNAVVEVLPSEEVQQQVEEVVTASSSLAVEVVQSTVEEQVVSKVATTADAPNAAEPLQPSTPIQVEQEQAVQVEQISFTNSTIHIENLNVSEAVAEQLNDKNVVTEHGEESAAATVKNELPAENKPSTGSRLPFNVVMLKSDKEKLAKKQQQQANFPKYEDVQLTQAAIYTSPAAVTENVPIVKKESEDLQELKDLLNEEDGQGDEKEVVALLEQAEELLEIVDRFDFPKVEEAVQKNELPEILEPIEQMIVQQAENDLLVGSKPQIQPAEVPQVEEVKEQPVAQIAVKESQEITKTPAVNGNEKLLAQDVLLNEPKPYHTPPTSILAPAEEMLEDKEWMEEQGENLVEALSHFQVQAQVESVVQGPAVTQFEITVGHGTKVSKVRNLSDDIQLALAARDIRIDAPIPGKRSIGIEIPNRVSRAVRLSEVTNSERFVKSDSPLEAALGLDLNGKPVTLDLRKMPHGLIAGATGSGKSVCINSILVSLLYKSAPHELKLMLIDPKMVELAPFNHIPHLVSPVITDVKAATEALKWAVEEMERRYQLFMHSGTRDITRYNKLCDENGMLAQKLPYLLIVIDELADLMMMSPADVELAISRLAQKARACGIHLILATQRPSVDVITGTLKSNIPTRIAFAVSSQIDSRTILDTPGAERLLGRGDMLYLGNGMNAPQRIQGTFVTDEEIEEVIEYVRSQGEPNYFFKSEELVKRSEVMEEQDELFEEVCRYVYSQGSASTSALQRKYHIGYNRAARLIDLLESNGFISEQKGSKPRDVYITEAMLENTFG